MYGAVNSLRMRYLSALSCMIVLGWAVAVHGDEGRPSAGSEGSPPSAIGDGDPENDESRPRHRYFSLDQFDAYLELESTYDYSRVKTGRRRPSRKGFTQKNSDMTFTEKAGFELGGMILDPQIITYSADFSFGLTQNRFKEESRFGDRTNRDSGYLLNYDLRVNLFQGRKISGTVYGLKQNDRISRRFQPTLREDRTGFGTSWFFADDKFPMELSYDYTETDRTGNRNQRDDEHFTESTLHYGVEWVISDRNRIKFSYEHAENKQEYQGLSVPFDTTRDLFLIDHELTFGSQDQHALRTLIHYQEESGDFARDFFEIGPQLTLQHTDNLQTMYKYQFNRERYQGLDIETHRADWQLVHQLYTNLTTTVDVFGLYEDVENDVKTTQYGTSVDWQYNRKNALGHFYANLALAYDTEQIGRASCRERV